MNFVRFDNLLKLAGFIIAVAGALAYFRIMMNKTKPANNSVRNSSNTFNLSIGTASGGLYDIAYALVTLAVGIAAIEKVNWAAGGFAIALIIGLAGAIKVLDKLNISGTEILAKFIPLATGLGTMCNALTMSNKVNWTAVFFLPLFITAIAGSIKVINKFKIRGNKNFEDLLKLGGGVAALGKALSLVKEINWKSALLLPTFILGIGLAIGAINKLKIVGLSGSTGGKNIFGSIMVLAAGLALLILTIAATKEVDWSGSFMIITFMILLSGSIFLVGKSGGRFGLVGFAFGLALIILTIAACSELYWPAALQLIAFITLLGLAIAMPALISKGRANSRTSGLFGFAIGLALIILTIDAARELDFSAAWKVLLVCATLTTIIATGSRISKNKFSGSSLIVFFTGVTLAVWLASVLITPVAYTAIAIVFSVMAGLLLIAKLYDNFKEKTFKNFAKASLLLSVSLALWVGFYYLLSYVSIDLNNVINFSVGLLLIGFAALFIGHNNSTIQKAAVPLLAIFPGLLLFTIVYGLLSFVNGNILNILIFGTTLLIVAGIALFIGKFDKTIKKGALILLLLSASFVVLAISFAIINSKPININNFVTLGIAIGILTGVSLILGIPAVATLAALGAAVLIGLSLSLWLIATIVYQISIIQINHDNIREFGISIGELAKAIGGNILYIAAAIPASIMLIPVATVSILLAGLFWVISLIKIKKENIDSFGNSIVSLIDNFNKIGIIATTKAVAKSALLLPVVGISLITAIALKGIEALNISDTKIEKFGNAISLLITAMCNVVDENKAKLEANAENFKIIANLANGMGSIVKIIDSMTNMSVSVWRYNSKTNQMEVVSKRQINDKDFDLINRNFGKMLRALIAPLSVINSDSEYWDFGDGNPIKNPFNKVDGFFGPKDNMSGINRIKAISDAFEKIPVILQGFCDNPLLTDVTDEGSIKMRKLQENIGTFFDTIIMCMNKLPQKSVLSNWFDGTASWLENTVQPVFNSSTIVLDGLQKSLFWKVGNINTLWPRVIGFFDTTKYVAQTVNDSKKYKMPKSFAKDAVEFYNELNKLSTNQWLTGNIETVAVNTKSLVDTLGDSGKFNQLNKNLQNTDKNIKSIVGNINKINVSKAAALERNLKLLTQAKSQEALREAIEQLKEMISLLKDVQEKQVSATNYQTNQFAQRFDTDNAFKANLSKTSDERNSEILIVLQKLQALFEGTGIHVETNLAGVSDEIVQALHEAGLTDKANSGWKGFSR